MCGYLYLQLLTPVLLLLVADTDTDTDTVDNRCFIGRITEDDINVDDYSL